MSGAKLPMHGRNHLPGGSDPIGLTIPPSGITRGSPIHTQLTSVTNALPQSDTVWTMYPFDLTDSITPPVGTEIGLGTQLPDDQYFAFDNENCAIGLPMGGIVFYEARFTAVNYPDVGTTWDMGIQATRSSDAQLYDPDTPPTVGSFFGLCPENVSIYDGAAMVSTNGCMVRELFSTSGDSEREWLQFFYMHNGPTTEDVNFSRILLELSFWPAGYMWNTAVIQGVSNGKGSLMIAPVIPTTVGSGDPITVTFDGEEQPTTTDWIACYPLGGDTDTYLENWIYTSSGTQTAGGTAVGAGTYTMEAPADPGFYQFRWLQEDTISVLVEGNSIIEVV